MHGGRSPAESPSCKVRQPGMRPGTWLPQRHAAGDAGHVPPMGRAQVLLHMQETPDARQSEGTGRQICRAKLEQNREALRSAPSTLSRPEQRADVCVKLRVAAEVGQRIHHQHHRVQNARHLHTPTTLTRVSDVPLQRFMSSCLTRGKYVHDHAYVSQSACSIQATLQQQGGSMQP